ncbi:Abi family protein [Enterococcus pseudoavium]|uniref:Abi family protein n=1 Tax=Enterococcus pseudoavium TaxID=44007 RepID=A0ABU3FFU0_9ENTE|nr:MULTISPECIES: Abi family protein [Enterococcus]MDT2604692.1 Abi family protein [Enterococcus dongliensis]MDT2769873.1 Abi family protein [Enterococcus pseudoavium]
MEHQQRKLPFQEMYAHMESKGISFKYLGKAEVINTLESKNYYYKLTAFRKNFTKKDGLYRDLDFSYLVDLASIDMQLRYLIMDMSLDIEHNIKTILLRLITTNDQEDGFSIVKEFELYDDYSFTKTLNTFRKSRYLDDMYRKRGNDIPVWTLVELMDFGSLCSFVKMYYKKYKNVQLEKAAKLMMFAKYLRNSAAHSNILSINVFGKNNRINGKPQAMVSSSAKLISIDPYQVGFKKVHDAICLFSLFKTYVSGQVRYLRKKEGLRLLTRSLRHEDWYKTNWQLNYMFTILYKLVDFL